jgi:hypothetical protein
MAAVTKNRTYGKIENFETRHPSDDSDQVWFQFGRVVSGEKIFEKVYDGRTTTLDAK